MEVTLTTEESGALHQALRTYLSDLRMEIGDTHDRKFREGLREERATLEQVVAKLDAACVGTELRDEEGREVVRLVTLWWSDA